MEDDRTRKMGHGCFIVLYAVRGDSLLLLLGQRNEATNSYPLWFELPGGTVEPGEDWKEGLAREVYEETGIRLREADIIPFRSYTRADQPLALLDTAIAHVTDLDVRKSPEWIGFAWVDPVQVVQLQNMILPAHARVIAEEKPG